MAKRTTSKVNKIKVRMYRVGTGDFFLLQFKKSTKVTFNMMIDCGCISAGKNDFPEKMDDLYDQTNGVIDLLVVTHEHADHINGFEKLADYFKQYMQVKKVWFAWTEEDEKWANAFRKEHSEVKMALKEATRQLNESLKDKSFAAMYEDDYNGAMMLHATEHFVNSLSGINELNYHVNLNTAKIPTMEDILRKFEVIKKDTIVEFYEPGNCIEDLVGAEGIRFLVMGPPKNNEYLKDGKGMKLEEEGYEKREKKSTLEMAFINAFNKDSKVDSDLLPFEEEYVLELDKNHEVKENYFNKKNNWRNIENEWLFSAGSLALRHETSINNTSLVLAIQFMDTEKILLFPGDAEKGNWLSWHDNLNWTIKDKNNKTITVDATYILNNTVFYKVGHHLSQNGTAKKYGLELMTNEELAAMATLDFKKINSGWLNTMPNDLIGEELIRKTKGKLLLLGDAEKILKNIMTDRVRISKTNLATFKRLNKAFDGKVYIDHEVSA